MNREELLSDQEIQEIARTIVLKRSPKELLEEAREIMFKRIESKAQPLNTTEGVNAQVTIATSFYCEQKGVHCSNEGKTQCDKCKENEPKAGFMFGDSSKPQRKCNS